jgi:hypothetical protein
MWVHSLECVGRLGMSRRSLDLGTKLIRSNNNLISYTEIATGEISWCQILEKATNCIGMCVGHTEATYLHDVGRITKAQKKKLRKFCTHSIRLQNLSC